MGFDTTAAELKQDWTPYGFSVKKSRRPKKDAPEWVFNDKQLIEKLCKDVKFKYQVAYLYWRLGWTTREIAGELLNGSEKFETIKSILYRIKNM